MPAAGRFVWYEMMASDADAARSFYAAVVGWKTQLVALPGMNYTLLKAGETEIAGLMPLPVAAARAGVRPCWVGYVGVDDVDDAVVQLQHLGGRMLRAPADAPGFGRFAVVADPQGAMFHVFSASEPRYLPASNAAGHVGWHELHAADWPQALAFYGAMFGWGRGATFETGALGSYQQFTICGTPAGGLYTSPLAQQGAFWLYFFHVGDIAAAAGRVLAAGGRVVNAPHEVPGGGWIVRATDPQGAMFALLGRRPRSGDEGRA
jgi:uncharacterized protein